MNIILVGLPFFKSISQGWISYYNRSSGPTFTEEQIRMADSAATTLLDCYPVDNFLDSAAHLEICKKLGRKEFIGASQALEQAAPQFDLSKAGCLEALKIGLWLLGSCSPDSIRDATYTLLACDWYFPRV